MWTEEAVESRLREHFRIGVPLGTHIHPDEIVAEHYRRFRTKRRVVSGVMLGVGVLAIALISTFGTGGGSETLSGPSLRLASYAFRLPSEFALGSTASCFPTATIEIPSSTSGQVYSGPYSSEAIANSVAQQGDCVAMAITVPYTPQPSNADPFEVTGSQTISINSYRGWVYTLTGPGGLEQVNLGVVVPNGGGQYRDIIVGTLGLTLSTVEQIVASGLPS